jgi:cytoskeletal protein RodZ
MSDTAQVPDSGSENPKEEPRRRRFRTGLLVLSSAAFGGLAVALWNRRTLARMQNESQESAPKPVPPDDEAIY